MPNQTFWATIASRGTPVVEQADNERYQLVTFLWRARGETRNVSVIGTFMKAAFAEPLEHLTGTDVWYRTFRVPAGARFSYFMSANAPLAFDGPDAAQQMATLQADPLNSNRWMCAPDADVPSFRIVRPTASGLPCRCVRHQRWLTTATRGSFSPSCSRRSRP